MGAASPSTPSITPTRVQGKKSAPERAFVLHSYAYKETSAIVDVFTALHGRMAMVAKGAKRPASNLRGVLLSLQPVEVVFTGKGEVKTLTQATWLPGQPWLTGQALMCGMYLNELIMKLLPREDPHPELFETYASALLTLAGSEAAEHSAVLREFEIALLSELGYGLILDRDVKTSEAIAADTLYRYDPMAGPSQAGAGMAVYGKVLIALESGRFETQAIVTASRDFVRSMMQFHLERRTVRSSVVIHDLHALSERLEIKPFRAKVKAA